MLSKTNTIVKNYYATWDVVLRNNYGEVLTATIGRSKHTSITTNFGAGSSMLKLHRNMKMTSMYI